VASAAVAAVSVAAVRRAAGDNNNERAFLNMALLTEHEQRKVAEAIARVERDTDAELVTVLAARADDYAYIPLLWASLLALVVPGALQYLTGWLTLHSLLWVQWASFIVLCLVFRIPRITTHLIPRSVRHWRASNLARRQFLEQNLHHTGGRGHLQTTRQLPLGRDCRGIHPAGSPRADVAGFRDVHRGLRRIAQGARAGDPCA
jgi:putative membrane protein